MGLPKVSLSPLMTLTKGQLISKANCEAEDSSKNKKQMNSLLLVCDVFCSFFGRILGQKKKFRDYLTFSSFFRKILISVWKLINSTMLNQRKIFIMNFKLNHFIPKICRSFFKENRDLIVSNFALSHTWDESIRTLWKLQHACRDTDLLLSYHYFNETRDELGKKIIGMFWN